MFSVCVWYTVAGRSLRWSVTGIDPLDPIYNIIYYYNVFLMQVYIN